jgi:ferritin-like metal-binding protein YciE
MGIFTQDIKTMEELFIHQLQDIYYAEQTAHQGYSEDG